MGGGIFSDIRSNGYIIMTQSSDENVVSLGDEVGIKVGEDSVEQIVSCGLQAEFSTSY
jgi:hypothetical protein